MDFYNASSLEQQSADRHVIPLEHFILILSQPVFALSSQCSMLSGEATNTNFIVFGLTRLGLEPMIYCTRGEHANHYNTVAVVLTGSHASIMFTSVVFYLESITFFVLPNLEDLWDFSVQL